MTRHIQLFAQLVLRLLERAIAALLIVKERSK